jgi:enoyl-[acyl-carrier protein] reductase I
MSGGVFCLIVYGSAACFPDYNDMADNKAYLESVARSFGFFWKGQKNRVNTISQSPTATRQVKLLKALILLHLLINGTVR